MSKRKGSRKSITPKVRKRANPPHTEALPSDRRFSKLLIGLALMVTTLVVFLPLRNHDFINLDDDPYVYDNPQVQSGLTLKGVIWAFTTMKTGNWHPLTWLSHMMDLLKAQCAVLQSPHRVLLQRGDFSLRAPQVPLWRDAFINNPAPFHSANRLRFPNRHAPWLTARCFFFNTLPKLALVRGSEHAGEARKTHLVGRPLNSPWVS